MLIGVVSHFVGVYLLKSVSDVVLSSSLPHIALSEGIEVGPPKFKSETVSSL